MRVFGLPLNVATVGRASLLDVSATGYYPIREQSRAPALPQSQIQAISGCIFRIHRDCAASIEGSNQVEQCNL